MSPLVKVCGITQESDARFALELGASKLGFILYNKSPRRINFEEILEIKKRDLTCNQIRWLLFRWNQRFQN